MSVRLTASSYTNCGPMRILIYNDDGAEHVDILHSAIVLSLKSLGMSAIQVDFVNAEMFSDSDVWKNVLLFVLPGGRDLPYVKKLKGHGDRAIQNFINNGGSYLGLCAGAYYACRYCEFQKGTEMEICGERELSLLPALAKGCVYPGFRYQSRAGGRMVELKLNKYLKSNKFISSFDTLRAYYNGGCEFILDEKESDSIQVLAHYADINNKVAITFHRYGRGRVVLSGVHPEMDVELLKKEDYSGIVWSQLQEFAGAQRNLLTALLSMLL